MENHLAEIADDILEYLNKQKSNSIPDKTELYSELPYESIQIDLVLMHLKEEGMHGYIRYRDTPTESNPDLQRVWITAEGIGFIENASFYIETSLPKNLNATDTAKHVKHPVLNPIQNIKKLRFSDWIFIMLGIIAIIISLMSF